LLAKVTEKSSKDQGEKEGLASVGGIDPKVLWQIRRRQTSKRKKIQRAEGSGRIWA